jgi:HlyD family secretion protein
MIKHISVILFLSLYGCGRSDDHAWLGYAEGDTALISAPQAGWVARMPVQRGDTVKVGDLLFTLDDTTEASTRDQAVANLTQAKADLVQAKATLEYARSALTRDSALYHLNATSTDTYDLAKSTFDEDQGHVTQIEGQIAQMQAALTGAAYVLSQRDVISQTHGQVQDIYFRVGEYAPAMTPIVSVLPPKNIYVRFFVPETEFAKVKVGQEVSITCDGCAKDITAKVTFIAAQEEFTPPVIFSVGSREKLVFKLEARALNGLKLNPGQPVEVRSL